MIKGGVKLKFVSFRSRL